MQTEFERACMRVSEVENGRQPAGPIWRHATLRHRKERFLITFSEIENARASTGVEVVSVVVPAPTAQGWGNGGPTRV